MPVELMTMAQYARHRGVSGEAVRKAIRTERITAVERDGKLMVDPVVADIQWAENTDPRQALRANARKGNMPTQPISGDREGDGGAYWTARTRREEADAERAEIELAKLRGTVADIEGMKRAAMVTGRLLRDTFLGLPRKLASEYAGMTDPFEIERNMEHAIRRILDEISALPVEDLEERSR